MDILAARKKAAERAAAKKTTEQEPVPAAPKPSSSESPEQGPHREEQTPQAALPHGEAAPAAGPALVPEPPRPDAAAPAAEAEKTAAAEIELLSFRLGGEEYAVLVDDVKEVLRVREFTPVPNAPDYVLGVTALRGPILPVIDLCRRLGLRPGTRDDKSRIVVVSIHDEDAGILVDRVTGVVRIAADAIRPAPETIEQGGEFLRGIVRKGDRLFILLDIAKAL